MTNKAREHLTHYSKKRRPAIPKKIRDGLDKNPLLV
jgi:hypothetical protein